MRADRTRPTLIYDGECGFCRRSVDWVQRWDREHRIALVPFQDRARVAAFNIPLPALAAAMHLVLPPPAAGASPARARAPGPLNRRPERAGWPGVSASRAGGPTAGARTPGSRGGGTAWCGGHA